MYGAKKILVVLTGLSMLLCGESKPIYGSTVGSYAKPGAKIDMDYVSHRVLKGERAEVTVTLLADPSYEKIRVRIGYDKALQVDFKTPVPAQLQIGSDGKSEPIVLFATAQSDGTYHINLFVEAKGRMRVFSVPVYVGEGESVMKKRTNGGGVKIVPATETLR